MYYPKDLDNLWNSLQDSKMREFIHEMEFVQCNLEGRADCIVILDSTINSPSLVNKPSSGGSVPCRLFAVKFRPETSSVSLQMKITDGIVPMRKLREIFRESVE
jgi:hypothetical protein